MTHSTVCRSRRGSSSGPDGAGEVERGVPLDVDGALAQNLGGRHWKKESEEENSQFQSTCFPKYGDNIFLKCFA